ncbi:MltA domain-containing protein [Sphingobium herbicidovorans NBRC 16415]|uniref:peptidoglycan lytic exotransglycosylase n=1 Tax=Sphingobium herbicidovorans (strain ATCC 700291 / DSM 11019 / CCUG 56400 / KCTC 2939 / LMG 18315 / NBRC 16415 / MH) TaxID=1219045 RepID=A0A086PAT0_SPHHM|nr:murein transglycosylase A [Sphingobium herbicidovorans]KFG90498.1 MltA domain-containing protein [Sphingobium herbicidovorans NBRC 16415]
MSLRQSGGALLAALLLSACAGGVIPPGALGAPPQRPSRGDETAVRPLPATPRPALPVTPPSAPVSETGTALAAGVTRGPDIASLIPAGERARKALEAFRISCPSLMRRTDQSGLTRGSDWNSACAAASSWPDANASEFFSRNFEAVQVGPGTAFVTGYYEPEIAGSRTRRAGYEVPIYRRPPDLIDVNLGLFSDSLKGKTIRGKVQGSNFVPYEERAQIVAGSLAGRGLEIAWAADPVEFFFLQVQGSGRLLLPDGGVMRIGYDGQNGRDYTGIGKLMKDRGLIQAGSMQDIMAWLRANPVEGAKIMDENKSFVFFRELTGAGPLGALGVPVTPEATVAADPKYVPLGAPVLLSLDRAEPNGVWIAQDTGGAIKGANRFDSFWGAGSRARTIAGGMSARGSALILLPVGSAARLVAQ